MPAFIPPTFYRPHIDGLRGVAVVAVVLYHAKLLSVNGGFVGVDVFFVISGFIITSVIRRELAEGTFSLVGFWERRVRRILPALFVVMCATIVAAYYFLLYPEDYQYLGQAITAQSIFASNILFMFSENYFGDQLRYSPLLHTWSLSVEEQFYIFFPLLAVCAVWVSRQTVLLRFHNQLSCCVTKIKNILPVRKANAESMESPHASTPNPAERVLIASVALLGTVSLVLNVWFVDVPHRFALELPFIPDELFWGTTYATAGFYLLLTRGWELALGALVALVAFKPRTQLAAEVLGTLGAVAIGMSVFLFDNETSFPGIAALLPTLGTAAIILANERYSTRVGELLSGRAIVFIGLISYALYLWHWPLFVFFEIAYPALFSSTTMAWLILLSVFLAWLTYRLVEMPIRAKTIFRKRKTVFLFGFIALATLLLSGLFISHGRPEDSNRIPLYAKKALRATHESIPWGGGCFQIEGDESAYGGVCRIGATPAHGGPLPQFVLWGDSHADALAPLLGAMGRAYARAGTVFYGGNCIPVVGVHQTPPALGCAEKNNFALRHIRDNNIRHVILVARWSQYVLEGKNGLPTNIISDARGVSASPQEAKAVFERNFAPMVAQLLLDGREVYIVLQVPEQPYFDARNVFYDAVRAGREIQLRGITLKDSQEYQALPNAVINSLAADPRVHVLDPSTILCKKDGLCDLAHEGKYIYRDESHLSTAGAMSLHPLFVPVFENMYPSANVAPTSTTTQLNEQ